ncbi:MAG: heme exporter protein CcmB [Actinobacteria bacterium]|nr:heme exporter protein CcmB [Actinomycetota bacterium]
MTGAGVRPRGKRAADPVAASRPRREVSFWRQVRELTRTDLRAERRSGEALLMVVPFGATALLIVPLAVGADVPLLRSLGPGLYWAIVLLFGALLAVRHTSTRSAAHQDLLDLLGVDPLAPLLARAAASTVLLVVFAVGLAPVAVAFYDPALDGWAWLAALVPLVAVGLAVLGTVAGALADGVDQRASLVPVLVVPLAVPLLIAATQAQQAAAHSQPPTGWLLLAVASDLVVLVALVAASRTLEESPR